MHLFVLVMMAQACHLSCEKQNFEYSDNGIPYPKLDVFAQSLLDAHNFVDLEDLIDGMNLTAQWGEDYLDLEGCIDQKWRMWRDSCIGRGWTEEDIERYNRNPTKKQDVWIKKTGDERKQLRQGYKYRPGMITWW